MFEFIIYLKAIATMLITNSHFDTIYPISQLSMGGSIGNSVFFWVSGYCLANIKPEDQSPWMGWLGICTDCGEYIFHA